MEGNEYHLLSNGWVVDFLRTFPTPVFAMPGTTLYKHLVHGHGFSQPIAESTPAIGFYTTVFTAAASVKEAQAKAIARMKSRWETFHPDADGVLFVDIEESTPLKRRFTLRSVLGLSLYSEDEDEVVETPDVWIQV